VRKHSELILKSVCCALAALVLFQLVRMVVRTNPLRGVHIPELPTLPGSANEKNVPGGTNGVSSNVAGTNATNGVTSQKSGNKATNSVSSVALEGNATNAPTAQISTKSDTNSLGTVETNAPSAQVAAKPETNSIHAKMHDKTGTAMSPKSVVDKALVNTAAKPSDKTGRPSPKDQPGMTKTPELPPIVQSRIDKIVQSEILAPRPRKMPMALLGIAGQDAFIRAPNGQTGLVKEGGELGGIKLLKIGVNRVLIEQEGEKKELTIFSGLGGENLLSKPKAVTNETIIKSK